MEWDFFFKDDPDENEHYLGYLSQYKKPYWVGYCDIKDGCEFGNATELVDSPIFDGKSLRERWNNTIICSIEGCCLDDWLMYFQHR